MKNNITGLNAVCGNSDRILNNDIYSAIIAAIFSLCFSVVFAEAFELTGMDMLVAVLPAAVSSTCVFISRFNFGKFVVPGILLLCAGSLIAISGIKNGILELTNIVLDHATKRTGRIFLELYSGEHADCLTGFLVCMIFVAVLVSLGVIHKNIAFFMPILILSTGGLLYEFLSTGILFAFFVVALVTVLVYILLPDNVDFNLTKNAVLFFAATVMLLIIPAVTADLITKDEINISSSVKKAVHSVIYDSKNNSMPEGNLSNLGAWDKSDAAALEITMTDPQKMYIKGFVGEEYSSDGWDKIDSKKIAEYADSFYWIHEHGYYPQSSIASVLTVLEKSKTEKMTVKNISACSEKAFIPYSFVDSELLDKHEISDAKTVSFGKNVTFEYVPSGLSEWFMAQVKLSESNGFEEYLLNENTYREFVYANYLDISEKNYKTLETIFADEEKEPSFTQITNIILAYFDENIEYSEKTVTKNGEEDFADYFLTKTAKGYSVHYATAATLMLRYYGIPARYVEGYFIPAAEAEKYESGEKIILTENHAHAWTEYYLDGIGWIPFEVTPGYIDDELEKAAFNAFGENIEDQQTDNPKTNIIEEKERDKLKENTTGLTAVFAVFGAILLLGIISLGVYIITGRKRLKKALDSISSADNNKFIAMRFGYAEMLSHKADLSKDELAEIGFDEIFAINKEAIFSDHTMSDGQRKEVDAYAENVLIKAKEKWSFTEKIINRWLKFIY